MQSTNYEAIRYTIFSSFLLLPPSCVTIFSSAFFFQSVLQLAYELTYRGKQTLPSELLYRFQAHPAYHTAGIGGSFPTGKTAGA
jgi:hypothetical protein